MNVVATVDSGGLIVAIAASPHDGPKLATPLQPGQKEVEITDHGIDDDTPEDRVHQLLVEIMQDRSRVGSAS